jgi:glycosyltransferase involved in cell wall biosynthesis
MEKGLDVFATRVAALRARGVAHKVLVVGEGPARGWFAERVPEACFTGILTGADLGRAVASMDVLFNPSVTETFGNVTLEAMASGVPVIAARATGSTSLVADGSTGRLVEPGDVAGFAEAIAGYVADPALRGAHGAAGEARSPRLLVGCDQQGGRRYLPAGSSRRGPTVQRSAPAAACRLA